MYPTYTGTPTGSGHPQRPARPLAMLHTPYYLLPIPGNLWVSLPQYGLPGLSAVNIVVADTFIQGYA
jgi:hypothetical protein